ncbi:MAG: methylmalonyl Co-A mutase-associated GTPase MeaB [Crocinitomicaceae bacterium]|nr:MAG: methylmalonyl Co-A mutase-associated GTPase MeaB [Crocinitomicaceae bacterium]
MDQQHLENWLNKRKERRASRSLETLMAGLKSGDRQVLAESITLVESTRKEDAVLATDLVQACLPFSGKSIRVGITGVPGVGKSTFIESFGKVLVDRGLKVAVLAIDPSSSTSGGSILGDKTRMQELSVNEQVFIRPSAAGVTLGGVARKTRESIYLCEAAGFDVILIETVGVGQSETLVHSMVDFFLLLMLAGAGDELQGIKRGIMEMADALVITKADGDNAKKAQMASREYANAMHLFPPKQSDWTAQAFTCSSYQNENIDKVWQVIESFVNHTKINGWFELHRKQQDKYWLAETLKEMILNDFFGDDLLAEELKKAEEDVFSGTISSFHAAEKLYDLFKNKK